MGSPAIQESAGHADLSMTLGIAYLQAGDPAKAEGLLKEVSFLVEYPLAVVGNFEKAFLSLPKEVLVNSMREHQRYFALEDSQGMLLPHFITISNTKAEDMDVVRAGNERAGAAASGAWRSARD